MKRAATPATHRPGGRVGQSAAVGGWAPDPPPRRPSEAAPGAVGGGLPACFASSLWRNSTSRCTRAGPPPPPAGRPPVPAPPPLGRHPLLRRPLAGPAAEA